MNFLIYSLIMTTHTCNLVASTNRFLFLIINYFKNLIIKQIFNQLFICSVLPHRGQNKCVFVVCSVSRAWFCHRMALQSGTRWFLDFFVGKKSIFPVMATPTSAVPNPLQTKPKLAFKSWSNFPVIVKNPYLILGIWFGY